MFTVPGPAVAQEHQISHWWGCLGPSPAVGSLQRIRPVQLMGWAVLERLIPTSSDTKDTHQGTSAFSALLSSPAWGAGSPLEPGALCASTSSFAGPAGLFLLMSTLLMPFQPCTTQTPRADVRLTSAPCCWQLGAAVLPDLTRVDRETFLTLQRPFSIQPPWESPRTGCGMHL